MAPSPERSEPLSEGDEYLPQYLKKNNCVPVGAMNEQPREG